MAYYRAGDIIRLNRLAVGMTQEELSENICSVETLSRIENGHHKVKKDTYHRLMERMNRIPEKSYAICCGKDMEFLEESVMVSNLMKNYEYEEASFYLERMEKKIGNDLLNQQYLKRWKAVVNYYNKKICAKMYLKQLKETISMTVPNYNKYLDEIYPFTEQELLIMMNLAGAYSEVKEYEKSIKIYQMLITCIEEGYIDTKNGGILKIVIKRNMAHTFGPLKRYQEAIDILKEVYELCLKLDYGYEIQLLLGDIAWNMMKQIEIGVRKNEDIALVKKYLRQSYYISAAREAANMCNKTKEYWNKYFDEEIEII